MTYEQVAIFLYTVTTGLAMWRVAEWFQRSMSTINRYVTPSLLQSKSYACQHKNFGCRYFYIVLNAIMHEDFYNSFVHLPGPHEPISQHITQNAKFAEYFVDCLGAMDSSHIYARVSPSEHTRYRNCKANITQNVIVVCSFDEPFMYIMSRWEGSAGDSLLYNAA